MTREEAIKILYTVLLLDKCDCSKEEIQECLKMAIRALEHYETVTEFADRCKECGKVKMDNDCIRRSDIGLTDFEIVMCDGNYKQALEMLLDKIEKAPAVIPQPKIGHWVWSAYDYDSPELGYWECSECNKVVLIPSFKTYNMYERFHYCPNCGAKMQEVEE